MNRRVTLFGLALLVYCLVPLLWLALAATKDNAALLDSFGLWPRGFSLFENLRALLEHDDGVFVRWLRNTLLYSLVSAGGAALLCAAAGYGFAKYDFRGKEALFWVLLASVMVPQTALAIPTYLLFAEVGLTNGPLAVILPSLVSPFGVYLMRIYAQDAVPDSLVEAARLDGAGELKIFRSIAFRLLAPGFVTVLLFTFVQTWNNYFLPLVMLSDPRWFPVTVGLAQWNGQAAGAGGAEVLFSLVVTGALVSIIPLVAAFLLLQRYWETGLSVGRVER